MKTIPMRVRNAYVDGLGDGVLAADWDRSEGFACDSIAADLRHDAHVAVERVHDDTTRVNAAYDLGYVRGYRRVIR